MTRSKTLPPASPEADSAATTGLTGLTALTAGLSRDDIASLAMAGWLASRVSQPHPVVMDRAQEVARYSYEMADAMIAAREVQS
jgi:hypothetical protein